LYCRPLAQPLFLLFQKGSVKKTKLCQIGLHLLLAARVCNVSCNIQILCHSCWFSCNPYGCLSGLCQLPNYSVPPNLPTTPAFNCCLRPLSPGAGTGAVNMDGNNLSSFTGGEGSIIFGGDTGTAISSRVMRRKGMLGAAWLRCLSFVRSCKGEVPRPSWTAFSARSSPLSRNSDDETL